MAVVSLPDVKPYFQESNISFELNIGKAIDLNRELMVQVDAYTKYLDSVEYCAADCKGKNMGTI